MIEREPDVPALTTDDIALLTEAVFGQAQLPQVCDLGFIFSGTHPLHWEKAVEAYRQGYVRQFLVTGGRSKTGQAHPDWPGGERTEAEVIIEHLVAGGVPRQAILHENQSTNSLENVLFAKDLIDFSRVKSILVICKSHVAGRQLRTLAQHLPDAIDLISYPFDTAYKGQTIRRSDWMTSDIGRRRVWGEYLRLLRYGELGHLKPLDNQLKGVHL